MDLIFFINNWRPCEASYDENKISKVFKVSLEFVSLIIFGKYSSIMFQTYCIFYLNLQLSIIFLISIIISLLNYEETYYILSYYNFNNKSLTIS